MNSFILKTKNDTSLDEKQKRYKDECVMSGKKVARLHLPSYMMKVYEDLEKGNFLLKIMNLTFMIWKF